AVARVDGGDFVAPHSHRRTEPGAAFDLTNRRVDEVAAQHACGAVRLIDVYPHVLQGAICGRKGLLHVLADEPLERLLLERGISLRRAVWAQKAYAEAFE